jgi:UDP-N-acetyl-D-glucosamine/UDP-N-acetyl-D-galactosamine dehydrogenase
VSELTSYGIKVNVCDPWADAAEVAHEYGLTLTAKENLPKADALIVAVSHHEFAKLIPSEAASLVQAGGVVIDVKSVLTPVDYQAAGFSFWRL